jgi:hypothetical protein
VLGFFCSQGRLQLRPEVTHCQFVQSDLICCCFHKAEAALPYHCNSVWSVPPPASWCNSVLSNTSSTRLPQQSTMALFQEVGLLPHLHSQPFCLTPPLLSDNSDPLGICLSPHLVLSLCSLSHLSSLRVLLLAPPPFSEAGSAFHPTPTVSV